MNEMSYAYDSLFAYTLFPFRLHHFSTISSLCKHHESLDLEILFVAAANWYSMLELNGNEMFNVLVHSIYDFDIEEDEVFYNTSILVKNGWWLEAYVHWLVHKKKPVFQKSNALT